MFLAEFLGEDLFFTDVEADKQRARRVVESL